VCSSDLRAQLKAADRSGARVALIVGAEEAASGKVAVRDLRQGGGQELVDQGGIVEHVRERLGS
jgi:histidyl-tRNA synthetase